MRNLHKFIKENHGLEAMWLLQEWEKWVVKDSDYKNHSRFTLRYISKDLIPFSVRLKSTGRSRSAREIIQRAEKQLLQDRIKYISGILHDTEVKVDSFRSRQLSIVTTTTMDRCIDFINKVRELRFIKVRDRQIKKSTY